jgi:hypothetical protein
MTEGWTGRVPLTNSPKPGGQAFLSSLLDHDHDRKAMSTDPKDLPDRIDIQNPLDVRHWAAELVCRRDDIRAAVDACGPDVPGVREFIRDVQAGRDQTKPHVRAQEMTAAAIARGKLGIKGA